MQIKACNTRTTNSINGRILSAAQKKQLTTASILTKHTIQLDQLHVPVQKSNTSKAIDSMDNKNTKCRAQCSCQQKHLGTTLVQCSMPPESNLCRHGFINIITSKIWRSDSLDWFLLLGYGASGAAKTSRLVEFRVVILRSKGNYTKALQVSR